jgi:hypothetical protein
LHARSPFSLLQTAQVQLRTSNTITFATLPRIARYAG